MLRQTWISEAVPFGWNGTWKRPIVNLVGNCLHVAWGACTGFEVFSSRSSVCECFSEHTAARLTGVVTA